jgi:signal transduction histidine kinase
MTRRVRHTHVDHASVRPIPATISWVRRAVGADDATIRVLLPDERGRLCVVASEGQNVAGGRMRSTRRRQVFATGRPLLVGLGSSSGRSLGIFPLISAGESIGVVEIVAPTDHLVDRGALVEAVVEQSATLFRSVREARESETELRATGAMLTLAAELLRMTSPVSAVRTTLRRCFEHVGVPMAGLLPDPSGEGWFVAAAHGLGGARRAALRTAARNVSERDHNAAMPQLAARFASVIGADGSDAIGCGDAVLLMGDPSPTHQAFLRSAGELLAEALDQVGAVTWAQVRNDNLDLAIAWTAHELKEPLVGARAALTHVLDSEERNPQGRDLLRRTRGELDQLAELVDPLLQWSAGAGSLQRTDGDLVAILRAAIASCCLEGGASRVAVRAPSRVPIVADRAQLRSALANVLRNALAYSPDDTVVEVVVETTDAGPRITVQDRGPGVPAAERDLIFDPFARGHGSGTREGTGLGLFIARRIVEAHGGTIGLLPSRRGARFHIDLPPSAEGSQAFGS